jgi:hypothetical protein
VEVVVAAELMAEGVVVAVVVAETTDAKVDT